MATKGDKGRAPAYQWYPKDYEMDERVKLMSLAQEGAYRRLLDHQWIHGSIPDDVTACAKICRTSVRAFAKLWAGVRICFDDFGDGRLVQRRLERQRTSASQFADNASKNGEKGAAKRWGAKRGDTAPPVGQPSEGDSHTNGHPIDEPLGSDSSPISDLQSPIRTHTDRAGTREHLGPRLIGNEHRAHAQCGRVCTPAFLHRQFKDALGGDDGKADTTLRDWYARINEALPEDEPVPTDAAKFWRPRFDAEFVKIAPVQAQKPVSPTRTGAAPAGKYAAVTGGLQ